MRSIADSDFRRGEIAEFYTPLLIDFYISYISLMLASLTPIAR